MEEEFALVTEDGKNPIDPSKVRPDLYDAAMFNTPSIEISARYGLKGICNTLSTGCTAGTDSLGYALEAIQDGLQDVMFAGAAEALITPITFGAFDVVNVLSARNDDPAGASRPFDNKRDGFVLSAGHASMLLYSILHLTGVKAVDPDYEVVGEPSVSLDNIKSLAPGRPHAQPVLRRAMTTSL